MATIINTMDRAISNSIKQNQIANILIKSFLIGTSGYSILILSLILSFRLISNFFNIGSSQVDSAVLVSLSFVYLAFYTFFLIKAMKINNFCK